MESCGDAMDTGVEAAHLVLNNAIEVADLVAAGGPEAFMAATESCLRTQNRLASLTRGYHVPQFMRPQAPTEARVIVDRERPPGRPGL